MAADAIYDINKVDLRKIAIPKNEILNLNPQRYEFEQLDAVHFLDLEELIAVGSKTQQRDEFWAKGHIPGRPLMPGVMMIEMAAQLSSILFHKKFVTNGKIFFGFGGVNNVKFRGSVSPGSTYIMMAKALKMRPRIAVIQTQGYVEGKLVYEGDITGIVL